MLLELIVLFVCVSLLINLFIYRKFIKCEWLFVKDVLMIIPFVIIITVMLILLDIFTFCLCVKKWFDNRILVRFIKSEIYSKEELEQEEKIKKEQMQNDWKGIKSLLDCKIGEK